MTTDTQDTDSRPIRNGAKPAWYNYVLTGIWNAGSFSLWAALFAVPVLVAIVAEIIFTPWAFLCWCYVSCAQARTITATEVGQTIPAQHGLGCLVRIWVRASPSFNLLAWLFRDSKPELLDSPCQAGCLTFHGFWTSKNWNG